MASPINDLESLLIYGQVMLRTVGYSTPPFPEDLDVRRRLISKAKDASGFVARFNADLVMVISFEQDALRSQHFDSIPEYEAQWPPMMILPQDGGKYWTTAEALAIVDSLLDAWRTILEARKAHLEIPPAIKTIVQSLLSAAADSDAPGNIFSKALDSLDEGVRTEALDRIVALARRQYGLQVYCKFQAFVRNVKSAFDGVAARLEVSLNQSGSPAEQSLEPQRKKRRVDPVKDARDKWIYQQCCKGTAYDTIALMLKNKSRKWDRIDTKQGIRFAAQDYATRHTLPPIPVRQDRDKE